MNAGIFSPGHNFSLGVFFFAYNFGLGVFFPGHNFSLGVFFFAQNFSLGIFFPCYHLGLRCFSSSAYFGPGTVHFSLSPGLLHPRFQLIARHYYRTGGKNSRPQYFIQTETARRFYIRLQFPYFLL